MTCTAHGRKNCTADACKRAARRRSEDSTAAYTDTFDTSAGYSSYDSPSSYDSSSSSSSSSDSGSSSSCD